MTHFPTIKIQGQLYHLDHLQPRQFDLTIASITYSIEVYYSWHVFTEASAIEKTPDFRYTHQGETRYFCIERYEQSKLLPDLIETLDHCFVYHSNRENYFFVKDLNPFPYHVFFIARPTPRRKDASIVLNVLSAYTKKRPIKSAPAIKFTTFVKLLSENKKIRRGQRVTVKRRK